MRAYKLSMFLTMTYMLSTPVLADKIPEADRTALHVTMTQFIDRQVIDGMYIKIDLASGNIERFSPAKSHPMVVKMGENFVLCTDFKNELGEASNVDFYVTRRGKSFAIFQTEINNRQPLMKLMEAGKAAMID